MLNLALMVSTKHVSRHIAKSMFSGSYSIRFNNL